MADLFGRVEAALAGRYSLGREIGRGGMAIVFLAEDLKHHRSVALKVLHPALALDLGATPFLREIKIVARLTHPHILPLHDSGVEQGIFYYVMPYVKGESLRSRLARDRELPLDDAREIAREVADALDYAHGQGVVHRDIKPENILLSEGHAVVADFGIARAIWAAGEDRHGETGFAVGTPAYMSPEQVYGQATIDGRSDLYSLACVVYEMLAGAPPFDGGSSIAIMMRSASGETPEIRKARPEVPEAVDRAIRRALAKSPDERFATATEFAAALLATDTEGAPLRRTARVRVPGSRVMLAVLPFDNVGAAEEEEYFADGMTDEMISQVGRLEPKRLGVIARTSAMRYRQTEKPVDQIGRELGVDYVLEGSVRRAPGRVRITAQLIETRDQTHLWAESYERDLADIFAIQSDVARRIARSLMIELLPAGKATRASHPTADSEAYEAYLKGRYYWNKRTEEGFKRSIEHFEDAIARDPEYALAHAGLADSYLLLGNFGSLPPREGYARAKGAAKRALAIEESLSQAHTSLAYALAILDWDWAGAGSEFERAIALDPGYATAHHWYALHLVAVGRADQAKEEIRTAQILDPLSLIISTAAAAIHFYAREYELAVEAYKQTLEMEPNFAAAHDYLGRCYHQMGRYEEAIEEFQKAIELSGQNPGYRAALGHTYAVAGRRDEAERILEELIELGERRTISPSDMAYLYAGLGRKDEAFAWLDVACRDRDGWLLDLKVDPSFDSLRSDPRFQSLLERIGLP